MWQVGPAVDLLEWLISPRLAPYSAAEREALERQAGARPEAWIELARQHERRLDRVQIDRALSRARELAPQQPEPWDASCPTYYDLQRFEEAEGFCTRALELRGEPDYSALLNRGLARIKLGKLDAAEADFRACRELEPDNAEAYIDESWVWAARGDIEHTIELARAGPIATSTTPTGPPSTPRRRTSASAATPAGRPSTAP